MERIRLTGKDEKILPVTINGKDIDLPFDAGNMRAKSEIITMMDDIISYSDEGSQLMQSVDKNEGKKAIKKVRSYAQKGLDLCSDLSARMALLCPTWRETVGDNFIDLNVFEQLLSAMLSIINERDTVAKVIEEMTSER